MAKTMKDSERAKKWKCVRFYINKDVDTKFNKKVRGEVMRNFYHFCVNYVEQLARGCSPTSVVEQVKFQEFRKVSEGLERKTLPEGHQSFSPAMQIETAKRLVNEIFNEFAPAVSHRPDQGVDSQADSSDNLQVGSDSGSARELDMTDKEDVDMQVNNPVEIQGDEVPVGAPNSDLGNTFSNDASSLNVAWNQCDNPEGRPPSRAPVPLEDIVLILDDLMHRALRFPDKLPKFEWSEEAFRSFVIQLESLEGAFEARSGTHFRSCEEQYYAPLADFTAYETSLPSMDKILADEIWSNIGTSPGRPEAPGTSSNLYARVGIPYFK